VNANHGTKIEQLFGVVVKETLNLVITFPTM
jgi:hypothetical protein